MQDPNGLFRLETDSDPLEAAAPVLIVALAGFFDAGSAQGLLVRHLMERYDHQVVATFDIDVLLDYRGRRPVMTYSSDHWSEYDDPMLALYRFVDDAGRPFLVLAGPEPDFQWERVVEAISRLALLLRVEVVVSVHGIPMAVPHTRPIGASFHATRPERRQGRRSVIGTVAVPGSVAALLELRLGEAGRDACGYAVHVPHYLAPGHYAPGALAVLERLREATGLDLPPGELATRALQTLAQLEGEVESDGELGPLVEALEQQYDELQATGRPDVPSADEIGEAVEQFLAEQDEKGE